MEARQQRRLLRLFLPAAPAFTELDETAVSGTDGIRDS
jgi:hypothetical protein